MNVFDVVVSRLAHETEEVVAFELRPLEGALLPSFAPGAHVDVHLGNGLIRPYSLCNGPGNLDHYLIAVKKEPQSRGGSRWMHEALRRGDIIRISEPKNNFTLQRGAAHYHLLAGGIGVTPILSMARALSADGASFILHYFVRSDEHIALKAQLDEACVGDRLRIYAGLDAAATANVLKDVLGKPAGGAQIYQCGPGPFMDSVCAIAANAGWANEQIHLERFSAEPGSVSTAGRGFAVRLVRSGRECTVKDGQTIVEALSRHGVEVPVSCESGVCGTCVTDVVSGEIDHRDVYLTDEEKRAGKKICLCVSRSLSEVLELDI